MLLPSVRAVSSGSVVPVPVPVRCCYDSGASVDALGELLPGGWAAGAELELGSSCGS